MEENYNEVLEEESSEFNSEDDSIQENESELSNEELLDEIRGLVNVSTNEQTISENGDEQLDLLESDPTLSPSVTPIPAIDYTQVLTDIKNQQIETNSKLSTIIDYQENTIFDKEISDYSITESILIVLVIVGLVAFIGMFIKRFTPKIWK